MYVNTSVLNQIKKQSKQRSVWLNGCVVKERNAYLANLQTLRLHLETEIDALHEAYHEIASC